MAEDPSELNQKEEQQRALERSRQLLQTRRQLLALPPPKALEQILEVPQPAALVHSFPAEDFYLLVHDIGAEDALPLLQLANQRQWEFLLDIEGWQKDRPDWPLVERWWHLMLRADAPRLVRWMLKDQTELFECYLFRHIDICVRQHDQDPSVFGDDFFTLDGTFYIRIIDQPQDADDEQAQTDRRALLEKLLKALARYDHIAYQNVLQETGSMIPAEVEEEAYRLRTQRLAEKGFLPFDEALGLYQPLSTAQFYLKGSKIQAKDPSAGQLPISVPLLATNLMEGEFAFSQALQQVQAPDAVQSLQAEFAGLCNQLISADQQPIRARERLKQVVRKACGYISLGLEELFRQTRPPGDNTTAEPGWMAHMIRTYPLINLFKVGYGQAMNLKWRAERWRRDSWFDRQGLGLGFWDQEWTGILGGLLLAKPLCFDARRTDRLYREFENSEDLVRTGQALDQIIAVDQMLALMGLTLKKRSYRFLTYKNLLLTLWACSYLNVQRELSPYPPPPYLHLTEFHLFFDDLFEPGPPPRQVASGFKDHFLHWLAATSGLKGFEIADLIGATLEALFDELRDDLGGVAREELEPRFIRLFLVEP